MQELDGAVEVVVAVKTVPGVAAMYDQSLDDAHTFAVGDGQFVVHNCSKWPEV